MKLLRAAIGDGMLSVYRKFCRSRGYSAVVDRWILLVALADAVGGIPCTSTFMVLTSRSPSGRPPRNLEMCRK
ncbi:hypothetical protein GQ43DRAFT_186528 [Delitschia confertaspora ATCC 74209]|uniref:Uncharacterized protein n=1 Tax=Delitschia confertaspora ATCC 74209 TaxID=1513339 RepID=A0A9P4JGH4_9PLEO|nr:hypothetical protein GQ43DRAFT_186528 [Delitschia confertaspora ATCC 74209]